MDLELSEDQRDLQGGIRSLLSGRFGSDRIREGFDRALWDEIADAGVFSLLDDGFTWSDATVVYEQLGEFCVPGPLVAGLLSSGLSGVEGVVGIVERPESAVPAMVEFADHLDTLVVLESDGLSAVSAADVRGESSSWPLDPLTPVTRVRALPRGEPVASAAIADDWRHRGAVLTAALEVGIAQRTCDLAVEYAQQREQFDRPIGSFQAIKHILADMAVRTEIARAAVYAAGAHLDDPAVGDLDRSISVAKLVASEAAISNGKAATQVFGGMGYTWEVDVHLYLKRAWVLQTHFGNADRHADALASAIAGA